jgi:hypothetical protein
VRALCAYGSAWAAIVTAPRKDDNLLYLLRQARCQCPMRRFPGTPGYQSRICITANAAADDSQNRAEAE